MLGVWSFFQDFLFRLSWLFGQMQSMDEKMLLVSCWSQAMLTQVLEVDPKCQLNISSFLTLPHPLDCFIFAKDMMTIMLLRKWWGYAKVGWVVMLGFGWGIMGGYHIFSTFCSVFVLLLIVISWLVHDSCFVCFYVLFFKLSLYLIPLTRHCSA